MRTAAKICVLVIGGIVISMLFIRSGDPEVLWRLKRIEDQVYKIGEFVLITCILSTLLMSKIFSCDIISLYFHFQP